MTKNSIMVLKPYFYEGMWVFDDEKTGLEREAFVAGCPEILEGLLQANNIPLDEGKKGFLLTFSSIPYPGHQLAATHDGEEAEGNWYKAENGQRGWLCPALFKYFETAPKNLYISVARKG